MNHFQKVSPAFDAFLSKAGPDDRREAIVLSRPPEPNDKPIRADLRALKTRLDYVKSLARTQKSFEPSVTKSYLKAAKSIAPKTHDLAVESVTGGVFPLQMMQVTRKTLQALEDDPNVVAVMPNQQIHLIKPKDVEYDKLATDESKNGTTWGLRHLDIPDIWGMKVKGEGVHVAVLDTGVHGIHPAFQRNKGSAIKEYIVVDPLGRRIKTDTAFDGDQHGTHVCGTIAGGKVAGKISVGVAPEAILLVAAVLIGNSTLRTLFEGIAWAIESGAEVINMSLGFSYYEPKFVEVFHRLVDEYGILPVVSVGNENHGNSGCPGNIYNALSVGAVEKRPGATNAVDVASFSSGASLVFPGEEPALVTKPDLTAPGHQILSAIPPEDQSGGDIIDFTYMSGTSMAAPHVSGVAALLLSANRRASVDEVVKVMKYTAKHPSGDAKRPDNRWGMGLVQPKAALKELGKK
jgi:subtilisin family serine protease